MSEQYAPATEIPLVDPENLELVEYQFNPIDFTVGSSAISLDYFNLLILQQQQADEAAAAATASQIASQASSMASADGILASGISLTQSFLATNTANDVVQSGLISALEGNVSILQDTVTTLDSAIHDQIVDISGSIANIEAEVSTNSGSITAIEGDITTLQSTTASQTTDITALQTDVETNSDDITSINTAIALLATIDNPSFTTAITCPQINLNGSIIASSTNISPTELSYLNNSSSNIQSQIDAAVSDIALKCPINNAALTGSPTCPNQSAGDSTTKIANTSFVSNAIANLISSSPSTLDTLNEIAIALNNDPSFATTITTLIGTKAPLASPTFTGTCVIPNLTVNTSISVPGSSISSSAIDNTHFSTLTSAQTISGAKTYTGLSTVSKMAENCYSLGTLGSTTCTLDFANGSCFYFTPFSSSNIALAITNVPTTNTSCTYSITSLINTSTYKVCGNSCTVNGNSTT